MNGEPNTGLTTLQVLIWAFLVFDKAPLGWRSETLPFPELVFRSSRDRHIDRFSHRAGTLLLCLEVLEIEDELARGSPFEFAHSRRPEFLGALELLVGFGEAEGILDCQAMLTQLLDRV